MEDSKRYVLENINQFFKRKVIIILKDEAKIKGVIIEKVYDNKDRIIEIIVLTDNNKLSIEVKNINSIDLDNEDFTREIAKNMGLFKEQVDEE